jgi:hypothetical protein
MKTINIILTYALLLVSGIGSFLISCNHEIKDNYEFVISKSFKINYYSDDSSSIDSIFMHISNRLPNIQVEINHVKFSENYDKPYIELQSPFGNTILKTNSFNIDDINRISDEIIRSDSLNNYYGLYENKLNSFMPDFIQVEGTTRFFEAGIWGNHIIPEYFAIENEFSVVIHSSPGCIPCLVLKDSLINSPHIINTFHLFYLDHFKDNDGNTYGPDNMRNNPPYEVRAYHSEKLLSWPTIWIINPDGKIQEIIGTDNIRNRNITSNNLKNHLIERIYYNKQDYYNIPIDPFITAADLIVLNDKIGIIDDNNFKNSHNPEINCEEIINKQENISPKKEKNTWKEYAVLGFSIAIFVVLSLL